MVYEEDSMDLSFTVSSDLSSYQYYLVKLSADNTVVLCTATTDTPIGVLQNKPTAAGQVARVRVHGVSRVICQAAIAYGERVGPHTNGKAINVTAGDKKTSFGICLVSGTTSTPATILMLNRGSVSV